MILRIAVLPGDGIGPEVSRQGVAVMKQVCQCAGHSVTFEHGLVGAAAIDAVGEPFPAETEKLCLDSDAILFSAVGDPKYDLDPNAKVRPEQGLLSMRKKLGLFANVRPVQSFKPLLNQSPLRLELIDGADFVCIRELTGGMYFGEKTETPDFASDVNSYRKSEVMRILRTAFEYARKRRRFLTVVDKANVLATGRLWRKTAQEMSAEYSDVEVEYMYVDNAAMRIVQEPRHFDVLVTENTFGDILTDEASVISGSLGLLPSASIGKKTPLFEPIHGSFPQAKGRNIANPMAQILSVAMLFEYFGCQKEANAIRQAVEDALAENIRTPDIQAPGHAPCTTAQVGTWIAQHILELGV